MPSDPRTLKDEFRRLSPWTIVFKLWTYVRYLLPSGAFIFYASDNIDWQFWLKLSIIPAVAGAIVAHIRYRYSLARGELIILTGLLGPLQNR